MIDSSLYSKELYPVVFHLQFEFISKLYQQLQLFSWLYPSETFVNLEGTRKAMREFKKDNITSDVLVGMRLVSENLCSTIEKCLEICSKLDGSISFEEYRKALKDYQREFDELKQPQFLNAYSTNEGTRTEFKEKGTWLIETLRGSVNPFAVRHMTIPPDLFCAIQRYVFLQSWFNALNDFSGEAEHTFAYSRKVQELLSMKDAFYRFSYLPRHRILVMDRFVNLLVTSDRKKTFSNLSLFLKTRSEELVEEIDLKEFDLAESGCWYNNLGARISTLFSKSSELSIFKQILSLQFPEAPIRIRRSLSGCFVLYLWVMQLRLGIPVFRNLAIEQGTQWTQETLSSSLIGDLFEDCGVSRDTSLNYLEPISRGAIDFVAQCFYYYSWFSNLRPSIMGYIFLNLLLSKGIQRVIGKMHQSVHESKSVASNSLLQAVLYLGVVLTSPKISSWLLPKFLGKQSESNKGPVTFPWLEGEGLERPQDEQVPWWKLEELEMLREERFQNEVLPTNSSKPR